MSTKRCTQCWQPKPWPDSFIGRKGKPIRMCQECQARYYGWETMTTSEKLSRIPPRVDPEPAGRVLFMQRSQNRKTGPIPVSISERGTCPTSCSLYDAGCYASYGKLGSHWKERGTSASHWLPWVEFLDRVRTLPEHQLWRHNEAGDLAGTGNFLDWSKLFELVEANIDRRGFTYTHKHDSANDVMLRHANDRGFTVNLSADTLSEVDQLCGRGWPYMGRSGPVVVLLPEDAPVRGVRTPDGRPVVTCPAQTSPGVSCADCELCANANRRSIVGFIPHGQTKGLISEIVRARRPSA